MKLTLAEVLSALIVLGFLALVFTPLFIRQSTLRQQVANCLQLQTHDACAECADSPQPMGKSCRDVLVKIGPKP